MKDLDFVQVGLDFVQDLDETMIGSLIRSCETIDPDFIMIDLEFEHNSRRTMIDHPLDYVSFDFVLTVLVPSSSREKFLKKKYNI